ncbi:MAG: rod shape-determining protein MreD [Clostridiales bacterium 38-18]|nr:MAG: rod shape-determining protein MreD [Clostridiales bacterium 38-18]
MKYRYIILLALVNFILSSTLFQLFRINGAMPNFTIVIAIILAALSTSQNAYIFAFISGAMQDIFLGRMLGVNFMIYGLIVYLVLYLVEVLFKGNFMTPLFLMAIGTIIYHFVFYLIMFFIQSTIPFSLMYLKIATEIAMNVLIGYFIYAWVFKRVHGYKLGDFNA